SLGFSPQRHFYNPFIFVYYKTLIRQIKGKRNHGTSGLLPGPLIDSLTGFHPGKALLGKCMQQTNGFLISTWSTRRSGVSGLSVTQTLTINNSSHYPKSMMPIFQ